MLFVCCIGYRFRIGWVVYAAGQWVSNDLFETICAQGTTGSRFWLISCRQLLKPNPGLVPSVRFAESRKRITVKKLTGISIAT